MKKPVLIGLLIAAALLGLLSVGAAARGDHRGDVRETPQAAVPMDCVGQPVCG
jgi:hypothetical protein